MGQSLRFGKYNTALTNDSSIFKTFASDDNRPRPAADKIPINRPYFDALLAREGLSLRGLAKRMGMSHSQLSLAFTGNRKLTLDEAARLSFMFGEPLHQVAENAGVTPYPTHSARVSVMGDMGKDGVVSARGGRDRVNAPDGLPANTVAIQCKTVGGALWWVDGAILFCGAPRGLDQAAVGRLGVAQIKDGPMVVSPVARGYKPGTFNLTWPEVRENVVLDWLAPVIMVRQ